MLPLKIKKLNPNAVIPKYAHDSDCCFDLIAISKTEKNFFIEYGTGLAFEIPDGYVGLVFPRSSISNSGLALANSVGVIDSGYRGEIKCRFYKHFNTEFEVGQKIAQIMILPFPKVSLVEVSELNESSRGENGFGSTGK